MTDAERISVLEQRIEKLENIIKLLTSNDDEELLRASLANAPVVLRCDFTDSSTFENLSWRLGNAILKSKEGALSFDISDNKQAEHFADPIVSIFDIDVDASNVKYLHVVFMTNHPKESLREWYDNNVYYNAYAQFYFRTDKNSEWSQSKSLSIYYCSGELVDCYVESKNALWRDRIIGIRFDPSEKLLGSAEIYLIELLSDAPASGVGGWMKNVNNRLDILDEKVEMTENKLNNTL